MSDKPSNDDVLYQLAKQVLGETGGGPQDNGVLVDFVRAVEEDEEGEVEPAEDEPEEEDE